MLDFILLALKVCRFWSNSWIQHIRYVWLIVKKVWKLSETRQTVVRSTKNIRIDILPLLAARKIPRSSEINITSHNWNFLDLDLFFAKFWFALTWYNVFHFSFCLQKQSFVREMKRPFILESFKSTSHASPGNRNIEEPQK